MAKPVSGTIVQKTFKQGVITLFGRFTATATGNTTQVPIVLDGACKGFASLVTGATADDGYVLTIDPSLKAQVILGAPSISYIFNTTATSGTNLVARTRTEVVGTSAPSSISFVVQNDAGTAAFFPTGSIISITLAISTSSVF